VGNVLEENFAVDQFSIVGQNLEKGQPIWGATVFIFRKMQGKI